MATNVETAWAAGIFEGEGWCDRGGRRQGDGTGSAAAGQKDPWILYRLSELFNGNVRQDNSLARKGKIMYYWRVSGENCRKFLRTIYPLLSPRRKARIDEGWPKLHD